MTPIELRLKLRLGTQLGLVALAVVTKSYYSAASVNQLRWILAPTALMVRILTGSRFEFESYTGYVNADHSFVIAASCAGVNFLITAFLMLSLNKLWKTYRHHQIAVSSWKFIPIAALCAYLATLAANTVRISTALRMRGRQIDVGLNANQLHRLEGILIYFGFLLLLFVVSDRLAQSKESVPSRRPGLLRQSLFPLAIYYATTLGVPLANSLRASGTVEPGFWEHSIFVLAAPLALILVIAALRSLTGAQSSNFSLRFRKQAI
ncbi:MAG TPA: exosortase K [Pyrinomonadaceae bacterium]|nr:exosortase K [Pyrinomonadaceae bacterium]